jgi:dipeptidyl aminopeptidase/acylaminoacyl peptidase
MDAETMRQDIRQAVLYREAESLYKTFREPGTGRISDAAEVHVAPDGQTAVFAGTLMDTLEGTPPTRICEVHLVSGAIKVLTFGPNLDRLPKYSPRGQHIAFLSDRRKAGDFQLYLLDIGTGAARATPCAAGWVEYLHWSPDGSQILLGVAGHGADTSGGQGAMTSARAAEAVPSWAPIVETGNENFRWRRAYVYEVATDRVYEVGPADLNIWEVVWCGDAMLGAVVSSGPSEGLWYSARLHIIDLETGCTREVFAPDDQIGSPAASPSGSHLAIIEAVCSDRGFVAGDVRVIDGNSGAVRRLDTRGVDVTYTEWCSDRRLLLAGHRGFETVVCLYDVTSGRLNETWSSESVTTGGIYVGVSALNATGDCVLVGESFTRAPEIAVIRQGGYQLVRSFDLGYADKAKVIKAAEKVSWNSPDGLEIHGWLLRPQGEGPHPLVMYVHGGPVWQWRPLWLGRRSVPIMMLLKRGYAIFFPNPRGSSGRGRDFARRVSGDVGGADTHDYLSGLDHLVRKGVADPTRLGVTGISYGGFMASWLITQDSRFAAAVPVAPVTNQVTARLIGNIPQYVDLSLADAYTNPLGKYFKRSPIMYAQNVKTPALNICGALDRCTPPEEAVQFHNALLENGVISVLVTYPEEGHGVRSFPAAIDFAARVVAWFQEHMPVSAEGSKSEVRDID